MSQINYCPKITVHECSIMTSNNEKGLNYQILLSKTTIMKHVVAAHSQIILSTCGPLTCTYIM